MDHVTGNGTSDGVCVFGNKSLRRGFGKLCSSGFDPGRVVCFFNDRKIWFPGGCADVRFVLRDIQAYKVSDFVINRLFQEAEPVSVGTWKKAANGFCCGWL